MIRRPPRSTLSSSSAASDVYKRQGSYIPNKPIRAIVERAVARRPGMKVSTVLREFGIEDVTHAKRLLGYSPYSGTDRPAATISVEHATRLLDAFGHDPVDVAGL